MTAKRKRASRGLRGTLPNLEHELSLMRRGYSLVAGIDEVGRGAWAGPVVAGAVILSHPAQENLREVNDSKQLSPRRRERLYGVIVEHCRAFGVGQATVEEIDALGILPATRLAMARAIQMLAPSPDALIIDAVHLPQVQQPQDVFNFADAISLSVAAASILAKVTRDRLMIELDTRHPAYGFARHKGYGTRLHQAALQSIGPCAIHRHSFRPIHILLAPHLI